jgi:hypothetical protein
MNARRWIAAVAVALGTLAAAGHAHGADKLRLERMDLRNSPGFRLYLTYVDGEGRVISGRNKEDFKLLLDSAEQGPAAALTPFETTTDLKDPKLPEVMNVVTVVQVSGAMQEVIEELKRGVKSLADAAGSKSKIGLLAYSSETKRIVELATPADYESGVASVGIDTEGVEVHMLDAVRTAIDLLNAAPKGQRKMIVLFSDGLDVNLERKAFFGIGKKAQEAGIIINTIGYAPFEVAKLKNLSELSKQSNGSERVCKTATEITQQFQNVADEMRKQYVVTFETALAGGDGKERTFQVIIEAPGHSAFSNTVIDKVPKATRPPVGKASRAWLWWLLGICGGLAVLALLAWLLLRGRSEMPEPLPVAAPPREPEAPRAPQRTMALDVSAGGKALMVGWIVGTNGHRANQTFKLKPSRTIIGTSPDCDVQVEDQYMSTKHCEVQFNGSTFKLVDLGSTNGIIVNDKRVKEHELVDNDMFRVGRSEFKFKSL